jgi:hypothetical protein
VEENHSENAAALGVSLDTVVKAKYPGAWAKHPDTAREHLQTYLIYIPEGDPFEVFLDADDALVTENSDQRRLDRLMEKIAQAPREPIGSDLTGPPSVAITLAALSDVPTHSVVRAPDTSEHSGAPAVLVLRSTPRLAAW